MNFGEPPSIELLRMRHSFLEADCYTANMGETLLLERPAVVKHGKRLEYLTIAWMPPKVS